VLRCGAPRSSSWAGSPSRTAVERHASLDLRPAAPGAGRLTRRRPRPRRGAVRLPALPRRSRQQRPTAGIVAALESSAALHPYATLILPGTIVRILSAHRYGDYTPLRLFYSVDETAIRFLRIEHYDEMEP
jgi:hypothetical protein